MNENYINFYEEFEHEIVSRIARGEINIPLAAQEYGISPSQINSWVLVR